MTPIELTDEEKSAVVIWLNIALREKLGQDYASTLNGLFKKLTDRDHEEWERRGGKYY